MTKTDRRVDVVAQAIYNAHWGVQRTGRYPLCWPDVPKPTKDWIREQAVAAIEAIERLREGPQLQEDEHGPA